MFAMFPVHQSVRVHQLINPLCCPLGVQQTTPQPSHQPTTPTGIQKFPFFSRLNSPSFHRGSAIFSSSSEEHSVRAHSQQFQLSIIPLQYPNRETETQLHATHPHKQLCFRQVAKYFPMSLFLKQKGEWIFSKVWPLVSYDVSSISLVG